jgi:peroxin-3
LAVDLEAFAAVVYSSNWESEINPINVDGNAPFTEKDGPAGPEVVPSESVTPDSKEVEESVVDVGATSTFESAWGKAVETVEKSEKEG